VLRSHTIPPLARHLIMLVVTLLLLGLWVVRELMKREDTMIIRLVLALDLGLEALRLQLQLVRIHRTLPIGSTPLWIAIDRGITIMDETLGWAQLEWGLRESLSSKF
jgi:hypothetical protein